MEDVTKTDLGRQAFAIMRRKPPLNRSEGLTALKDLMAQAETPDERDEVGWAIEGFQAQALPDPGELSHLIQLMIENQLVIEN